MKKGFTLIELLAVIVVLGIVITIAIPTVNNIISNAKIRVYKANESNLLDAAETYFSVNNELYPKSIDEPKIIVLADLVSEGYIEPIRDPDNENDYCEGYIEVKMISDGAYQCKSYINCEDYVTEGYIGEDQIVTEPTLKPTYTISETGWAVSKVVTIDYRTPNYIKEYSLDGGITWLNSTTQIEKITFNSVGSVIARVTDEVTTLTGMTFNVSKIDATAPTSVSVGIKEVTSNSIEVVGSGEDLESGISYYKFSKDNGSNWTSWQPNNIYVFEDLTTGTYSIKVEVINAAGFSTMSGTISQATTIIEIPTYSVAPIGWATSKVVAIDYRTTDYIKQYSTDGGITWDTSSAQIEEITFTNNGSVITRITDGVNIVTASTFNVTGIDTTAPTNVSIVVGITTSNSIAVTAEGGDLESGISDYRFSKDNGVTWTTWQLSNAYTFTNLTTGTYSIKVEVRNNVNLSTASATVNKSTTIIPVPTYSVTPTGWATSKIVTINYQTTEYVKEYSINGGTSWTTSTTQTKDISFNDNGSVIARVTDGVNIVTASTFNVTQITDPLITLFNTTYKNGSNFFVGANPNNWVEFGQVSSTNATPIMWRIIKHDNEGIKIIYEGTKNGTSLPTEDGRATTRAWHASNMNQWEYPSDLNTYLKSWCNGLYAVNKTNYIVPINWCIGPSGNDNYRTNQVTTSSFLSTECVNGTYNGGSFIGKTSTKSGCGLIRASDYFGTSSASTCTGSRGYDAVNEGADCSIIGITVTNFLYKPDYYWWTATARGNGPGGAWAASYSGYVSSYYASSTNGGVRPVINLSKDVLYRDGNGTLSSPYRIH